MAVQQILTLPNPLLRQQAKPVKKINGQVLGIIQDLKDTLTAAKSPKGVGLSAPQIGQSLRIILVWSGASRRFLTMINPEVIWHSSRTRLGVPDRRNPYEGCLSAPGIWGKARRFSVVKVRWETTNEQEVVRKFRGFTGVIIQHEIDHLNGILFVDRILQQGGKIYQVEKNEKNQMVFQEIKLVNEFPNKQPD